MKKFAVVVLSGIMALSLAACGGSSTQTGQAAASDKTAESTGADNSGATVIKLGNSVSEDSPYNIGAQKFKEIVEEKTNGRYEIQIYPNSQIGGERDLIEGVQMGSVGISITASAPVANFCKELNVLEIPFLIRDYDHADKILLGDIGNELEEKVSNSAGVKCLGFWDNGFRSLVTRDKKVEHVSDIQGLKIRTMENSYHQALWKALGADATPMAWGDAYTAVQQGALDGLENAISLLYSLKTAEITKYLAVTEHLYSAGIVLMNQDIWNSMSAEDQAIFEEAFSEAGLYEREEARKLADDAEAGMAAEGLEVTHPDKQELYDATKDVRAELSKDFEDLVARIEAVE